MFLVDLVECGFSFTSMTTYVSEDLDSGAYLSSCGVPVTGRCTGEIDFFLRKMMFFYVRS